MATVNSGNRRRVSSGSSRGRSTSQTTRRSDGRKPLQGRDTGYRVGSSRRQNSSRSINPRIIIVGVVGLLLLIAIVFGISSCVRGCSNQGKKDSAKEQEQQVNPDDERVAFGVSSDVTAKLGAVLDRNEAFEKIAKSADKITDERLIDLAIAEPDAIEFVAGSVKANGSSQPYGEVVTQGTYPQLYTFDTRWGYLPYADGIMGVTGSGPVALSMAAMGLTGKNTYDPARFGYVSDTSPNITYYDDNFTVMQGIDVSEHQGEIDWETVADAGYGFVFVRVGFRGYGEEGTLNEDTMAVEYLQEAEKAGLQVGAYFFSQAINEEEAAEEAQFAADIVKKSGVTLDLPLVYDPEFAPYKGGRANYLTGKQVCKNTDAFRDAAEKAIKCKVALYTNLYWENNMYDAETLNEYEIWYADYEDVPDTPYHFTWWQYSESAAVPGIKGEMDLNLWIRRMD